MKSLYTLGQHAADASMDAHGEIVPVAIAYEVIREMEAESDDQCYYVEAAPLNHFCVLPRFVPNAFVSGYEDRALELQL